MKNSMQLKFALLIWNTVDEMLALVAKTIDPISGWVPIESDLYPGYWMLDRNSEYLGKFDEDCLWISPTDADANHLHKLELSLIAAISQQVGGCLQHRCDVNQGHLHHEHIDNIEDIKDSEDIECEYDPMDSRKTLTTFLEQVKADMDVMLKNDPELWWQELDKVRIKQRELLTLSPVYDPLGDGLSSLQLIDVMGADLSVVNDARASFKKLSSEFDSKDRKLLSYLANANPPHWSPFRGCVLKFRVSANLATARQWYKHAVASSHVDDQLQHNEQSYRYTEVIQPEFYAPTQYYKQSQNNKQASDGKLLPNANEEAIALVKRNQEMAFQTYQSLLELGVSREDARNSLPVGTYTTWVWTVSLQALVHFIELRKGNGAQHQIVAYTKVLDEIVTRLFPEVAYACLRDVVKNV